MVFIREIELPMKIRGYTSPDEDDNYNIYINKDLSDDAKQKALEHELSHIEKGHLFCEEMSVYSIEKEVDE